MVETVAIIPARGGSKGIPQKNLVEICGKPLIVWSVEQALAAGSIDSVWVSSDSDTILEVAIDAGARPIKRPENISHDTASSEAAWLHAIDEIEKAGHKPDQVVGIQATSPIRESDDFEQALKEFTVGGYDSLFTVMEMEDFLVWKDGGAAGYSPVNYDYENRQMRQAIERRYLENGSFYVFKTELLRQTNNRLGGVIGIYKMAKYKMYQIDDLDDVILCEVIMSGYNLID